MHNDLQPASALTSPRFCNTGTFMRIPRIADVENPDFAIVGIPYDCACSYRTGARFGPQAIRAISAMIKPANAIMGVNVLENLHGADYGDVAITPGYIHPTYEAIEREIGALIDRDIFPLALGGDHCITLGELRAVAKKHGPVALVHFDSHTDICDEVFGQKYNHGTPFRRALEEGLIDVSKSIQVGMRGSLYYPDEHDLSRKLGFDIIPTHEMREIGLKAVIERIIKRVGDSPVFLTFDIDFVDPAYAPGTGTPEVGGWTSWEALALVRAMRDLNLVGMDVVEVLPSFDHGEITAYLAANIAFEAISILAVQKKEGRR
ncbi:MULTISPECIES: agmatinase [unclassified Adlercreutzia]|uniref:agmatinase n=1 Tax=unclassified Adlercreutzia TaxID=2636013 RepID=UPI0013ED65C2|nr:MULTISPECIES: agmatinase [unclassified Adlercreutzia]